MKYLQLVLMLVILVLVYPIITRAQSSFELVLNSPENQFLFSSDIDNSGNFYFVGIKTELSSGMKSAYLLKIDDEGNIVNELNIGIPDSIMYFSDVAFFEDTLYVFGCKGLMGIGYDLLWELKFDLDLNLLYEKVEEILPGHYLLGAGAIINHDQNIILGGNGYLRDDSQNIDWFMYEISRAYDSIRFVLDGGAGSQRMMDFFQNPVNNEYKAFGHHSPSPYSSNDDIVTYDSSFAILSVDSLACHIRAQLSTRILDDSTYLVAGWKSAIPDLDMGVVKLTMNDIALNTTSFGSPDTIEHVGIRSLDFKTPDNIYFIGCSNFISGQFPFQVDNSWVYIVNMDSNLNLNWQRFYGGDAFYNPRGLIATDDGGCMIYGERFDEAINYEEFDSFIIKVDSNGLVTGTNDLPALGQEAILVSPNPSSGRVVFQFPGVSQLKNKQLLIFNALGAVVFKTEISGNTDRLPKDLSFLPSGLYFASMLSNGNRVATGKFIIERMSD